MTREHITRATSPVPDLFKAPETDEECRAVFQYHIEELTRFAAGDDPRVALFAKMGLAYESMPGSTEMRQYRISIYYAYCRALLGDIYQIPFRKVYDTTGNEIGAYMLDQSEQQEFSVWENGVAEVHPPTDRWRFCEHAIGAFRDGYKEELASIPQEIRALIDTHIFPSMFRQMYGVEIGEAERQIIADPKLFFFHFDDYFGDALSDTWDMTTKTRKWGFLTNIAHLPLRSDLSIFQFLKLHVMPLVGWYSLYRNNDLYTYLCEEAERTGIPVLDLMKLQGKHERAHLTIDSVFYGLMPFDESTLLREGFVSHYANPELIPSVISGAAEELGEGMDTQQKSELIQALLDKTKTFNYALGNAFVLALGARKGSISLEQLSQSEDPVTLARSSLNSIFVQAAEAAVYQGKFFNTATEAISYLVDEDCQEEPFTQYIVEAMRIISTYCTTVAEQQRSRQTDDLFKVGEKGYERVLPRSKYTRGKPDERIEVFWVPTLNFCNPFPPSITGFGRPTV